ncbi:MAG: glycosyltransferase family 4 protein [Nitriliruptorales bacterium]|nr:glycosyltransferase family 4 protein [Nitriliruptorales bacterium]
MRIALVCPYDMSIPGGVQIHVRNLARQLLAEGDDVQIVGAGPPRGGEDWIGVGGSRGIPINRSVAPVSLGAGTWKRTLDALADFAPDVVHIHEPVVPLVSVAAAWYRGAGLVGTFHAWSENDRLYRAARPLGRAVMKRLDVAIAVGTDCAAYHARAIGVPASRFRVVPNGVHVSRFAAPARPRDTSRPPRLLFVGRLEPRKGLPVLIRAFVMLKAHHPDARLKVIGDGPERAESEALLPAHLRDDVEWLGNIDNDLTPAHYAETDIYCSPARGGESFGIVLIEGMAAGAAVVASDIIGYRDVLRGDVDGVLVPPSDPRALANALRDLLDNEAKRFALAQAGNERAKDFDWPVVTARLKQLYAEAIAEPTSKDMS